jgi:hypothetical protein
MGGAAACILADDTQQKADERAALFKQLVEVFCTAFDRHVRQSDCGWFGKLQSSDPEVITEVESFRQISEHLLPYSPNESFFGQYDGRMKANKQVRVDSLGAQAMATSNGTFDAISSYNKLTLLLVRNYARRTRNKRKRELDTAKQDAAQCKLARVAGKRDADLRKKQMKFALSLIHYGVVPDTLEEFDAIMADTAHGCVGKRESCLRENYHCITTGWAYAEGLTTADSKAKRCELCNCACTGGWKKDKHMAVITNNSNSVSVVVIAVFDAASHTCTPIVSFNTHPLRSTCVFC